MKEFKLKENFAGKKKGDIIILDNNTATWNYKGAVIGVSSKSELLLEVIQTKPLVFTNEDEVYYGATKTELFHGDEYWVVAKDDSKLGCHLVGNYKADRDTTYSFDSNKRFLTKKIAEDYINLQQAIKDSGLTLDSRGFEGKRYYQVDTSTSLYHCFSDNCQDYYPIGFKIFNETPCVLLRCVDDRQLTWGQPLKQFTDGK